MDTKPFARELRRNQTNAERRLWFYLRNRGLNGAKFRRQFRIGDFIVDFCCCEKKLIIELDGGQHQKQQIQDQIRTEKLRSQGYLVVRFWNHEVMNQILSVLNKIRQKLTGDNR